MTRLRVEIDVSERDIQRISAGQPATIAPAGTSFVTVAPAPTTASLPTRTGRMVAFDPRLAPSSMIVGSHFSFSGWGGMVSLMNMTP